VLRQRRRGPLLAEKFDPAAANGWCVCTTNSRAGTDEKRSSDADADAVAGEFLKWRRPIESRRCVAEAAGSFSRRRGGVHVEGPCDGRADNEDDACCVQERQRTAAQPRGRMGMNNPGGTVLVRLDGRHGSTRGGAARRNSYAPPVGTTLQAPPACFQIWAKPS
jgi:hypothetical protein